MKLILNSLDARKDVGGTRSMDIAWPRAKNEQLQVPGCVTGLERPPRQSNQRLNASFLEPGLTALVLAFASAGQSLRCVAAAFGRPITPSGTRLFGALYELRVRRTGDS